MSEIEIEVKGLNELKINMEKYDAKIRQKLDDIIQSAALNILSDAKRHAPVDTGRLRNSIHYEKTGEAAAEVGTNVEYAIVQEFGSSKMRAHPFMRPAADENAPKLVADIKSTLKDVKP